MSFDLPPPISKKMLLCCFSDHERWVLALGGGNDSIFPTDGGILFVSSRSSRSSFMALSCRQLTQATSSAPEYPSICWQYGLYFWLSMTHEDTNLAFFLETRSEVLDLEGSNRLECYFEKTCSSRNVTLCVKEAYLCNTWHASIHSIVWGIGMDAHLQDLLGRRLETKRNQRISFGCLPDISLTAFFADRRTCLSSSGISTALNCGCIVTSNFNFPKVPQERVERPPRSRGKS